MTLEKYTSYKDSKVDWIGKIPEHWNITKLKYLGTSTIGLTYNPNDLCNKEEGTLVLRSSNIQNGKLTFDDNVYVKSNIPKKLFIKENDILICSRNGSRELIGKCAIAKKEDESYSFGAFTTVFRSKLNSYLFQILNSEIFKKQSGKFLTSTINQLTVGNLNSFEIPLPPKQEQTKIALFLDVKTAQINEVISQKEKLIALLKERKQIVTNEAVTKGLDKNVELVDSGVEWIGKIPKHWEILPGLRVFKENKRKNTGMIDDRVLSLSYGRIIRKAKEKLVGLVPESFETYQIVKTGDIIIRCTDLQNDKVSLRTALAKDDGIITSAYLNLNVKDGSSEYWHYLLHVLDITKAIYKLGSGLRQNLSFVDFKRLNIVLPPKQEQLQIVEYIENQTTKIDKTIELQQNYITKLKEYKATLIDSVVTGKVRVA
ncbi:MAG: restriction endonuclease subunit S [Sulfurospirillaceae bacterium]|nr:restriction endonuclease subunit S [Sulfurospirillaceae bacterium]MDD2826520.1 restriction endonuclease subunit S [Sulfurospirillaceae bacterium]